jgi:hypothetical protein
VKDILQACPCPSVCLAFFQWHKATCMTGGYFSVAMETSGFQCWKMLHNNLKWSNLKRATMTSDYTNATMPYMMWHEENLCNVSILQRVHLPNLLTSIKLQHVACSKCTGNVNFGQQIFSLMWWHKSKLFKNKPYLEKVKMVYSMLHINFSLSAY